MSAIYPISMGQSYINLTDTANPDNELTINGRFVYITDTSNNVVTETIAWSQLIDIVSNCDAVVQNPNDATLKLNHILLLDDGVNTRTITPTSNPATTIDTTSDNTSGTYYIPFVKTSAGTNQQLFIDDTTGPLSYSPSNSTLTATLFSPTSIQVSARVQLPTATAENPVFTAGTGTLSIVNTTSGYSFTNWTYSHTSATNISALSFTNFRTYGLFTLYFTNNSGSSINWNTGLGANILTSYGTARTIINGGKAVITIQYDGTTYYITFTGF